MYQEKSGNPGHNQANALREKTAKKISDIRSVHGIHRQGDQIGRIFAQWTIVYFGQEFCLFLKWPTFKATFFTDNIMH
jgi:hypothetical protein